jgi:hypothetical protein
MKTIVTGPSSAIRSSANHHGGWNREQSTGSAGFSRGGAQPSASGLGHPTLELTALSDHEWRIRNATIAEDDARSIVGFVRRVGATFELTGVAAPVTSQYFPSLSRCVAAAALRYFSAVAEQTPPPAGRVTTR